MRSKTILGLCLFILFLGQIQPALSAESVPLAFKPDVETKENIAAALWLKNYNPTAIPSKILQRIESKMNSNASFGERMRWNLLRMLENPDSFTPDYTELYMTYFDHAEELNAHQVCAIANNLGLDSSSGYKKIPQEITFQFPWDDRPQFKYQCGWHFFVGSVFSENGKEFGVQLMFWTQAILPPNRAHYLGLTDIENQIVEMHFAISRAGDRHYRAKPTVVAGTTGLVAFSSSPFNYVFGKNYMRSLKKGSLFPLRLRAWGVDPGEATPTEIEVDLTVKQNKNYVLNGDGGLDPSCGGIGTLYVSVPSLSIVPNQSWIKVKGQKYRLAKGKMWYDHQWATGFNPTGNVRSEPMRAAKNLQPKKPDGWDWLMIQFDDNTEMSISALHTAENSGFYDQTGDTPPGTMKAGAYGFYVDKSGAQHPFKATVTVPEWVKSTKSYGQYLATGTWYPNRADITLDAGNSGVPENKRTFSMIPIVNTGQQGFFAAGWEYSEGAVYLEQNGRRVGRGFLEAPGYAFKDGIKQSLRIAGLPDSAEMLDIITRSQYVSEELKTQSQKYLDIPKNFLQLQEDLAACRGLHD